MFHRIIREANPAPPYEGPVENRHYVTDIHATILKQQGLDSRRLEVPGRKRLDIDHGKPINEILA